MSRLKLGFIYLDEELKEHKDYVNQYNKYLNSLLDDRLEGMLVGYDSFYKINTISLITKRCELFRSNVELQDDLSNFEEVFKNVFALWRTLPTEEYWKEQAEGKFKGRNIKFNRIFAGYRFSDEDVAKLLNEETIEFIDEKGNAFKGYLEEQEYKGFRYYGFKSIPTVPTELSGVKLDEETRTRLLNGEELYITNLYSKKKNTFYSAYVRFDKEIGIQFRFK